MEWTHTHFVSAGPTNHEPELIGSELWEAESEIIHDDVKGDQLDLVQVRSSLLMEMDWVMRQKVFV